VKQILGKHVNEGQGKPVGMRILQNGKLEQTVVMQGTLLGEDLQTTWTSDSETRPDGTMYVEARGFFITKNESKGTFKVIGYGLMKPDGSGTARGVVCHACLPGRFAQ
jgi:hypothetical protein